MFVGYDVAGISSDIVRTCAAFDDVAADIGICRNSIIPRTASGVFDAIPKIAISIAENAVSIILTEKPNLQPDRRVLEADRVNASAAVDGICSTTTFKDVIAGAT
ncbi:hypothetical protein ASF32_14570 [Methylobacterium sp. Leaf91]|nr:hypothetical protein ASF24_04445 [Methylobacterium sp. Leaf86]KQO99075.1 hypothetical protein ASF32_14570 [Methylobacterium sp. Leaf91]